MQNKMTLEQKVDLLISVTPLRYLSRTSLNMGIGHDGKCVYIDGVQVGNVEWVRDFIKPDFKRSMWNAIKDLLFPVKKDNRMEFQVVDVFGQTWRGRGVSGGIGSFMKMKELP